MKKFIVAALCAVCLIGLYFALSALCPLGSGEKMPVPVGITLRKFTLQWNYVAAADEYGILVEGESEERISKTNKIYLRYSDDGKTVRIRAISSDGKTESSDYSAPFEINFADNIEEIVTYVIEKTDYSRTEFIYNGVVKVFSPDLSARGYEFSYWYKISGGEEIPVLNDISSNERTVLYGKVVPVNYKLNMVAGDFPLPANAMTEYNVENYLDIFKIKGRKDGYEIKEWFLDMGLTIPLDKNKPTTGELTIYPRISLINEELYFDDNGFVSGFEGSEKSVFVPGEYNGKSVVKVKSKAFWLSVADDGAISGGNPSNIVFYSDNISVEKNGIGYAGENGSIIFEGNVTLCGGAIRIPDEEDGKLSIVIKGDFNLESGFVSGMLGEYKTSVTIYVSSDKVSLVPVGNYTVLPLEDFNG